MPVQCSSGTKNASPYSEAEPSAGAGAPPVHRPRQAGDADGGQRPDAQAREGRGRRQPGEQRDERRPARARPASAAAGPGPATATASDEYRREPRQPGGGAQPCSPSTPLSKIGAPSRTVARHAGSAAPGSSTGSPLDGSSVGVPDREGGRRTGGEHATRPAGRGPPAARCAPRTPRPGPARPTRRAGGRPPAPRPTARARSPARRSRRRAARRPRRGRRTG